jgi:hypothetical protein
MWQFEYAQNSYSRNNGYDSSSYGCGNGWGGYGEGY